MPFDFQPAPHEQAAALIRGKPALARSVFDQLLPELRARAFTIAGVESANVQQRVRDSIAAIAEGTNWDDAKDDIIAELDPFLGDNSERRAELLLRTHGFQAFQAANWQYAQADDDTTHLQYLTMEDDRVRPGHAALDGVIVPKHDPFWHTHFPPWEWGCRCRTRPMNPDLVDEARKKDEDRPPDDQLVFHGAALRKLREGTLVRNGQTRSILPSPDESAFAWHPDNLTIPLDQLQARYDPQVWAAFEAWAQIQELPGTGGRSLWDWLRGGGEEFQAAYNPDEPRIPAGSPGGGEWGSDGGIGLAIADKKDTIKKDHERQNPARSGATGRSLESAADHAGRGAQAIPGHDATVSERVARVEIEQSRLRSFAAENGLLKGKLPPEDTRGGEHTVHFDEKNLRVIKATRPDAQKGYGIAFGSQSQGATPSEYLDRLAAHNRIFNDDVKLERIVPAGGKLSIITSQPFIRGRDATAPEIDSMMAGKGFRKIGEGTFYHAGEGLLVHDLTPSNAKVSHSSRVHAIDPVIQRVTPDFARDLEASPVSPMRKAA